jgi:hypothetical protein
MFTWICPQCGREVPPAYNECPDCTGKQAGQAPPQPGQGVPIAPPPGPAAPPYSQPQQYALPQQYAPPQQYTPPQQYAPPTQYAPPQQYAPPTQYTQPPQYTPPPPQYTQPPQYAQPQPVSNTPAPGFALPQPAGGLSLPPWLMTIGFAVLFLAVGAALFFGIKHFSGSSDASANSAAPAETAPATAAAGTKAGNSTLPKYVEIVGMRLTEDSKKTPEVHFVVVNHSGAEISDLAANVNLWARTAKSDEEAVGTFSFKVASLGPYESKDLSGPLNTKLRVYELPDWQNLTAEVQITSPQ